MYMWLALYQLSYLHRPPPFFFSFESHCVALADLKYIILLIAFFCMQGHRCVPQLIVTNTIPHFNDYKFIQFHAYLCTQLGVLGSTGGGRVDF